MYLVISVRLRLFTFIHLQQLMNSKINLATHGTFLHSYYPADSVVWIHFNGFKRRPLSECLEHHAKKICDVFPVFWVQVSLRLTLFFITPVSMQKSTNDILRSVKVIKIASELLLLCQKASLLFGFVSGISLRFLIKWYLEWCLSMWIWLKSDEFSSLILIVLLNDSFR